MIKFFAKHCDIWADTLDRKYMLCSVTFSVADVWIAANDSSLGQGAIINIIIESLIIIGTCEYSVHFGTGPTIVDMVAVDATICTTSI
jgi:hypothetical protein